MSFLRNVGVVLGLCALMILAVWHDEAVAAINVVRRMLRKPPLRYWTAAARALYGVGEGGERR